MRSKLFVIYIFAGKDRYIGQMVLGKLSIFHKDDARIVLCSLKTNLPQSAKEKSYHSRIKIKYGPRLIPKAYSK